MSEAKLEAYFFTTVFITVLVLTGYVFFPFVGALALALVLATLAMPLHEHLLKRIGHGGLSAFIVLLVVTFAILLPAIGLFFLLLEEVSGITARIATYDFSRMPAFFAACEERMRTFAPFLANIDLSSAVQQSFQALGSQVASLLTGAASTLFSLFVSVFALYYFLKDGDAFVKMFVRLSPLTDDEDQQIVRKIKSVSRSLIRGTLVIALLQGLLTGIGFLIFGVPNPVLWGFVAAIASVLPNLGTGLVAVPAAVYLFLTGHVVAGIGFTAWGLLVVGLSDNLIRPYLIGRDTEMHPLFVLLSLLGGVAVFGISGLLLGPLILGLMIALSDIYIAKIKEIHRLAAE